MDFHLYHIKIKKIANFCILWVRFFFLHINAYFCILTVHLKYVLILFHILLYDFTLQHKN